MSMCMYKSIFTRKMICINIIIIITISITIIAVFINTQRCKNYQLAQYNHIHSAYTNASSNNNEPN